MSEIDFCWECGNQEYTEHKISCSSKKLFDSYITLRDNSLHQFTDTQLTTIGFNVWCEEQDRFIHEFKEI